MIRKIFICYIILIIPFLTSGCKKEISQEIATEQTSYIDNSQTETEKVIDKSSQEYLSKFENIKVNDGVYKDVMCNAPITSQKIYYNENEEIVMNEITTSDVSENSWYKASNSYTYWLELDETNREWIIGDKYSVPMEVKEQIVLEDGLKGTYNLYLIGMSVSLENEYMLLTKIEEWPIEKDANSYGQVDLSISKLLNDNMYINISGNLGSYKFNDKSIAIYNSKGTEMNYYVETNGFKYTNKDNPRYTLKIVFKESTGEIFLEKIDNKIDTLSRDKSVDVYKLKRV